MAIVGGMAGAAGAGYLTANVTDNTLLRSLGTGAGALLGGSIGSAIPQRKKLTDIIEESRR